MHKALKYIHDHEQALRNEHEPSDAAGMLTEPARAILEKSGGLRLLQAESHGGFESSPTDFFEWVCAVGRYNNSAGWIASFVGVHPWVIALVDAQLQDEIYSSNPDTWVASPYAPQGRAKREGDGFRFSGRWQYSSGTDHCNWIVLGGMVVDAEGAPDSPPDVRHLFPSIARSATQPWQKWKRTWLPALATSATWRMSSMLAGRTMSLKQTSIASLCTKPRIERLNPLPM